MNSREASRDSVGHGIDRTLIRAMLALSPTVRIARLAQEARFIRSIDRAGAATRRVAPTPSPARESQ